MLVALVVVIIGYHLVRLAFEAHALVASAAGHSIATIHTIYWNLACFVGTLTNTVILHVLLENLVTSYFRLFACQSWMIAQLDKEKITLQLMQKVERQTSHSIESALIMLTCLHPGLKQNVMMSDLLTTYWLVAIVWIFAQWLWSNRISKSSITISLKQWGHFKGNKDASAKAEFTYWSMQSLQNLWLQFWSRYGLWGYSQQIPQTSALIISSSGTVSDSMKCIR